MSFKTAGAGLHSPAEGGLGGARLCYILAQHCSSSYSIQTHPRSQPLLSRRKPTKILRLYQIFSPKRLDKRAGLWYNKYVAEMNACVAQLVVQLIRNEQVAGSNPVTSSLGKPSGFGVRRFLCWRNEQGKGRNHDEKSLSQQESPPQGQA